MQKIIIFFLISLSIWAAPYSVGEKIEPMELVDQFGHKHHVPSMLELLIFASDKETSLIVHECLNKQNNEYLLTYKAAYIADISMMPTFVAEAFALPKMRKYPYRMLLIRDEEMGLKFPALEQKITLIRLRGNVIQGIEYISSVNELQGAIEK